MEPILEVNGKKYRVLKTYHESVIPSPDFLKNILHIRRKDGTLFIVKEIVDVEFQDLGIPLLTATINKEE